jgi:hypothetical protein
LLSFEKYLFFIPAKPGPPPGKYPRLTYLSLSFFCTSPRSTGYFLKNKWFGFFKGVKIVKNILPAFVSSKRHKGNKATRQQESSLRAEHLPETGNWCQRTGNREL